MKRTWVQDPIAYNRNSTDVFAVQEEIAKAMTTALRTRLAGDDEKRMTKSYTANPEAYQDYLRGRYWWNRATEGGLNKGVEYFQQAIEKDPTYALAYSGLADTYTSFTSDSLRPAAETYPRAKEAAPKARRLMIPSAKLTLRWQGSRLIMSWTGQAQRRNPSEPLSSIRVTPPPTSGTP